MKQTCNKMRPHSVNYISWKGIVSRGRAREYWLWNLVHSIKPLEQPNFILTEGNRTITTTITLLKRSNALAAELQGVQELYATVWIGAGLIFPHSHLVHWRIETISWRPCINFTKLITFCLLLVLNSYSSAGCCLF